MLMSQATAALSKRLYLPVTILGWKALHTLVSALNTVGFSKVPGRLIY